MQCFVPVTVLCYSHECSSDSHLFFTSFTKESWAFQIKSCIIIFINCQPAALFCECLSNSRPTTFGVTWRKNAAWTLSANTHNHLRVFSNNIGVCLTFHRKGKTHLLNILNADKTSHTLQTALSVSRNHMHECLVILSMLASGPGRAHQLYKRVDQVELDYVTAGIFSLPLFRKV